MKKKYLCIVDGKMEKQQDTLKDYLYKNEKIIDNYGYNSNLYLF